MQNITKHFPGVLARDGASLEIARQLPRADW